MKKPLRCGGRGKTRYPQGREDDILCHSFSFENPAGKCQAKAENQHNSSEQNSTLSMKVSGMKAA
jgi:hypothetical protein